MKTDLRRFEARLAVDDGEIAASQRLRYRVFVEEMGATVSALHHARRLEFDAFDRHADHLVVIDRKHPSPDRLDHVVGSYRLLRDQVASAGPGFYGTAEYDLGKLAGSARRSVELGRSCVDPAYRGGPAMLMLWNALADYVARHGIQLLFGVASFPGTDPAPIAEALANLHWQHLAPEDIRVRALPGRYLDMAMLPKAQINKARALANTPALIQAYLRHGGFVGDGAVIDLAFNTIDVFLVMDTERMQAKYLKFYGRDLRRNAA